MSDNEVLSLDYGVGDSDGLEEENVEADLLLHRDLVISGEFLGCTFESVDIAFKVYNAHARLKGFSVRRCTERKIPTSGIITSKNFVCSKAGKRDAKHIDRPNRQRQHRALMRCECAAKLRLSYDFDKKVYEVTRYVAVHNHELVEAALVPQLRSQRHVDEAHTSQAMFLRRSGVRTRRIMSHFTKESGGYASVGFTEKDLYQKLYLEMIKEKQNGDVNESLQWLEDRKQADSSFFYAYTVDKSYRLDKLFFSNGRSIEEYAVFGDCLLFDATYKTNGYKFPLVILSGVNNHRSTCVFGTTLVQNETIESYVWILETFKKVMKQKMPSSVITDGDKSMHAAVERVFPHAIRRLCIWHLGRNATKHIQLKDFRTIFSNIASLDCSKTKFDRRYWLMAHQNGLEHKKWIVDTYDTRSTWAEAYLQEYFFADCRSTQRCESLNAVLKRTFNEPKCTLIYFLKNYFRAMETSRLKSLQLEHDTNHTDVVLTTALKQIERSASKVFTRTIFYRFKENIESQGALPYRNHTRTASKH